jgi:hypothetical protein
LVDKNAQLTYYRRGKREENNTPSPSVKCKLKIYLPRKSVFLEIGRILWAGKEARIFVSRIYFIGLFYGEELVFIGHF